jgi:excisionase family DNA binding protein
MALDTRDPLAIRYTGDRYEVIADVLASFGDDADVDLDSITLGISQAAKALGYTPYHVREMIKQRKLLAHKVNNQWRIPLRLVW